jgi:glycosyltransferase involved in cell wall biosynthesis
MSEPLPLSLVIIARDAAHELPDCLASAAFAAETVVVDSGSSDDTAAVAARCGARVIEHAWEGFGPQKNFAVGQASHDWVLCLDADERVTPELAAAITALFAGTQPAAAASTQPAAAASTQPAAAASTQPAAAAYSISRRNRFLGRWLTHGEGYPDWNIRLFDRRRARWSDDLVHEKVVADGAAARLQGDLLHASAESIDAYIAKQNRYTTVQAEAMHARGERATAAQMVLSPVVRFVRFYVFRLGFLDGLAGFAHIAIGAFASFLKYAKLRALQQDGQAR